jgi:predicted secreted protein
MLPKLQSGEVIVITGGKYVGRKGTVVKQTDQMTCVRLNDSEKEVRVMTSNVSIVGVVNELNVQAGKKVVINAVKVELEEMRQRMAELILLLEKLDM